MLDKAQCEFLLKNNTIQIVTQFLHKNGLTNIRVCKPETEKQKGKIVLLLNNLKKHDDLKICQLLKELHTLKEFNKNPHRKDFVFQIEERTQQFFKKRMVNSAVPFTENGIQELADKLNENFDLDVKEDESVDDLLILHVEIRVKKSRLDDKKELIKAVTESTKATVEPHIVKNNHKRTLSQG